MWQDFRYGFRTLAKNPGFSTVAIAALALGIGSNATVFSLANAILFKSLPFKDSDKILYVTTREPRGFGGLSMPDYQDLGSQQRSLAALGASTRTRSSMSDDLTVPDSVGGAYVSANTFEILGVPPILGRGFQPADEKPGAPAVMALSYALWEKRYGKDPSIIGRTIRVDAAPVTVVGVLAKGVLFPTESEFWRPLIAAGTEKRDDRGLTVYGKLAPGYTQESAQAEFAGLAERLAGQYPQTNRNTRFLLQNFHEVSLRGPVRQIFLVLLGAVGFVLMIACANVANLMLSRAVGRSREISIRAALGAGRWRVVRQLLAESLLLAVAGGAIGLVIAQWGTRAFDAAVVPTGKPSWIDFSMDYRAFGYLAAMSLSATIVFGLAPALRLSRLDVNSALKDGGRSGGAGMRGKYLSGTLVVVEMTLAVVLLAGAGLMIRSFLRTYNQPLGFNPDNLLTLRVDLPSKKYPKTEDVLTFQRQVIERMRALPGVQMAAVGSSLPTMGNPRMEYVVEDAPADTKRPSVEVALAGEGYFETLQVTALRGRLFEALEYNGGQNVALVNQTMANQAWAGKDPVGKRVRLFEGNVPGPWLTVVGVFPEMMISAQRTTVEPALYQPYRQDAARQFMSLVARTRVPPASLGAALRGVVQAVDRDLPARDLSTMEDLLAMNRWPIRVFGSMFAIFAGIALLLATVGLYAVVAYGVSRRTQEIGVRVALGATSPGILRMVFAGGIRQALIGLVLGLAAAFGVTRLLSALLAGVSPTDPLTFGLVAAVLLGAATLGCLMPARRAMRVDPVVALRHE